MSVAGPGLSAEASVLVSIEVRNESGAESLVGVAQRSAFVKGFRTPASHWREGVRGGRRPKSLEGGNRGGVCVGGAVGLWGFSAVYGDLAPAFELIFRSRIGTAFERALRGWCRSPRVRREG
jgi:hypothetical protein